ncbi:MAG TPA: hypothetical protein VGO80_05875 [Solirubrobacteraceae bacterium]|jgi:hypothetical protein|nr:hypothetical protein [Solirubrobacteraceae bacterium]
MPVPILPAGELVVLYGAAWQERDEDGRLRRIVGFLAPPAAA